MKIFLIGYRCTGKTTAGQILANTVGFDFIDLDQAIERQSKLNITQIIAKYGWDRFRGLENQALFNLKKNTNLVVATGGGIITNPDNLKLIKNSGFSIWLDADIKTILHRLKNDINTLSSRPSLTGKDFFKETQELVTQRKPLYEKCAHMKIDTKDKTPEQIANLISRRMKHVRQQHR